MSDFSFGPAGMFIWPSYGMALIVFVGLAFIAHRNLRHWTRAAKQDETDKS